MTAEEEMWMASVEAVVAVVGKPDRNGDVFTEETLREAAKKNENLVFRDGVLCWTGSIILPEESDA